MDQHGESPVIIFEEDDSLRMKSRRELGTPKMVRWTIEHSGGLIRNEKQANYVLLGFVALAFIISLFLNFGGGQELPPDKLMKL